MRSQLRHSIPLREPFRTALMGGFNWAAYWAHSGLFLFFGQYENITGGRLYNEITGSTDYLTVAGVAGSETYQCPNTAPYIAADINVVGASDYIWFRTDAVQRTVTTAELIGYDFTRTIVNYDDANPYAINWIGILADGVVLTETQINQLHASFHLPLFWSGVLNINGYVKGNRGLAQQPWTPEVLYEDEVIAYLALLGTPLSEGHATLINNFVVAIKTGLGITNLNEIFDVIRIYANETAEAALKNLVQNAYHATAVNAPTFTALEGYKHVAATSYIDGNYNPGGAGTFNYKQDDASYGYYSRTDVAETSIDCGIIAGGISVYCYSWHATAGNIMRMRINDANNHDEPLTDSLGMYIHSRPAAATVTSYKNGVALTVTNPIQASTGIPNGNFYELTFNNAGTPGATYSNRQLSLFFAGKGLSAAQALVIFNAFESYMDASGKGVVA